MDIKVQKTQQWLNQTYGDNQAFQIVDEDGITGGNTVRALIRALQIELNLEVDGVFGNTTAKAFQPLDKNSDSAIEKINHQIYILQGALYCKGQGLDPYYFNGIYTDLTEAAIKRFQKYAGLNESEQNGITDAQVMQALLNTDAYTLLRTGDSSIRTIQQSLNCNYHSYIGLIPCDGVFSKKTMRALISGLQIEQKKTYTNTVVDGVWGPTTMNRCPTLQMYGTVTNKQYIYLLQYALYANGFDPNGFDGGVGNGVKKAVTEFQAFCGLTADGIVGKQTWASLMVSHGDQGRMGIACDFMRPLSDAQAETLVQSGRELVGRYITGGARKKLGFDEMKILYNAGLKIFPIYQTSGNYREYFSAAHGRRDAYAAFRALRETYFPNGSTVYFAVDFDATVDEVNQFILPYFKEIKETFDTFGDNKYNIGIYGPRYVCTLVHNAGYSTSSFVCDMSSGFACNIGFPLPVDWAFDQISTITLGSGTGAIEIDNNIASGRDVGILINPSSSFIKDEKEKYITQVSIAGKICESQSLPQDIFTPGFRLTFNEKIRVYNTPWLEVFLTVSQTTSTPSGSFDLEINVTNGNFDEAGASISRTIDNMLAEITLPDDAPRIDFVSLATAISDGKFSVKITNTPEAVEVEVTSVVYDLETKDPNSQEVSVGICYCFKKNYTPPSPEHVEAHNAIMDLLQADLEELPIGLITLGVLTAIIFLTGEGTALLAAISPFVSRFMAT